MRRRLLLATAVLLVAACAGAAVTAHAASDRRQSFLDASASLRAQWARDQQDGVPAASLSPLRSRLAQEAPSSPWWSPAWFGDDSARLLADLRDRTAAAVAAALDGERTQAEALIAQWQAFSSQQSEWLSSDARTTADPWAVQLAAARTPKDIAALVSAWSTFLAAQNQAVLDAQRTRLDAELASAGGPDALLATARRLLSVATADNLDAGQVPQLSDQLAAQLRSNDSSALATAQQLVTAVSSLQSLVALNTQVSSQILPLLWTVDQARAESTPSAGSFAGQEHAIETQLVAARTQDQLSAVQQSIAALNAQMAAELTAAQCGHAVGSGKVITISLSLQEMLFYQDGCVVKATPVSTGRPQLRTPTGRFAIFDKQSPFTFHSPWPPGSPFWYPDSPVSWVMEFASGGYFIHDAPWEAEGAYGPGSEDNQYAASHGCVHTPTDVMRWAYQWTPIGTPVIITN